MGHKEGQFYHTNPSTSLRTNYTNC